MSFGSAEYAFSSLGNEAPKSLPDGVRGELLDAMAANMMRPAQSEEDQKRLCKTMAPIAIRLLDTFSAVQAGMLQPVIENCKTSRQEEDHSFVADACASVDHCLKAADLEPKVARKARLKDEAAMLAQNARDPLRALDITDSFTAEERAALPNWPQERLSYLSMSLDSLRKVHDTDRIQRLLDDTADAQRSEAMIAFSGTLMRGEDKPYALLMLSQARVTLEKYPADNPHVYLQLLSSYTRYLPEEATRVFGLGLPCSEELLGGRFDLVGWPVLRN